ncbi:MAG: hypothetical protein WA373_02425 [Burkholderiales bacterium]
MDRHLGGRFRAWAVVAAFGDNLRDTAARLARQLDLTPPEIDALRELGEALNYNAYGETEADLTIAPARLYERMRPFADPLRFAAAEPVVQRLTAAKTADLNSARDIAPMHVDDRTAVFVLPDAAWSRRVVGAFANELAAEAPDRAHAVLAPNSQRGFSVSVRAPLSHPVGADAFCQQFPSGGGRTGAAGIDHLPAADVRRFVTRFTQTQWNPA